MEILSASVTLYAVAVVSATFGLLIGCALGANARSRLVEEIERLGGGQ